MNRVVMSEMTREIIRGRTRGAMADFGLSIADFGLQSADCGPKHRKVKELDDPEGFPIADWGFWISDLAGRNSSTDYTDGGRFPMTLLLSQPLP
jgi:hypothetical protein